MNKTKPMPNLISFTKMLEFIAYVEKASQDIFSYHKRYTDILCCFRIIFLFWLITFWIAGLYDITKLRNEELFYKTLLTAFAANTALSIAFFYFIPYFIITPKISMFIDLALTALILYFWRGYYNKWARKAFKIGVIFFGG